MEQRGVCAILLLTGLVLAAVFLKVKIESCAYKKLNQETISMIVAINVLVEDGLNRPPPKQRNIRVDIIVPVIIAGLIVISSLVLYIYYKRRKLQNKKGNKFGILSMENFDELCWVIHCLTIFLNCSAKNKFLGKMGNCSLVRK